jgi:hypothetical protein
MSANTRAHDISRVFFKLSSDAGLLREMIGLSAGLLADMHVCAAKGRRGQLFDRGLDPAPSWWQGRALLQTSSAWMGARQEHAVSNARNADLRDGPNGSTD